MARYKVKDEDLVGLAELYNFEGKQAVYEMLKTRFHVKNPTCVFKRMIENPTLFYNAEKNCFEIGKMQHSEDVFMSMEELCSPIVPQHVATKERNEIDSRPAEMDKLIREL